MKRRLLILLAPMLLLCANMSAFEVDGLRYEFEEGGNGVYVAGYMGEPTSVVIPEAVVDPNTGTSCAVTSIGDWAFYECSSLTEVVIGDSVTSIGDNAFAECSALTEVVIGDSVTSIGGNAFFRCESFTKVVIPDSVTSIGDKAFWVCPLETIYFNAERCENGAYSSMGAQNLILGSNVNVLPAGVSGENVEFTQGLEVIQDVDFRPIYTVHLTDIEEWATNTPLNFHPKDEANSLSLDYKGKQVVDVALGAKAEKIGAYAFAYSDVESVSMSSYLTEIGEGAFTYTAISEAVIPEGVATIGANAFSHCDNLYEVSLPSTLAYLGESAFEGDISLYEIEIPGTVAAIGMNAFKDCIDLETVKLNEGLEVIGEGAFKNCYRLRFPEFPNSLIAIEDMAFDRSPEYFNWEDYIPTPEDIVFNGELIFGDNLTTIGANAFANGFWDYPEGVLTVKLPEGLESIGDGAFKLLPIREIKLPSTLEYLGERAFERTSISEMVLPNSLKNVGKGACANMPKLIKVTLPDGVTSIGDGAFADSPVGKINLPTTLTSIGTNAFRNTSLINCVIPEGVTSIGDGAFYNSGLNNCAIPDAVTEIGEKVFSEINYVILGTGIKSLTKSLADNISVLELKSATPPTLNNDRLGFTPDIVIVPEGAGDTYKKNNRWKDYNISARNSNKAVVYVSEPGTLATELRIQTGIMPALVTNLVVEGTLNDDDFAVMRSNMTSCYDIDLSGITNTSLSPNTFSGKQTLLQLSLPSKLEEIGEQAFNGCSVLHLTALPSTLTTIGAGAFVGCSSMDLALKFPATLKRIGEGAFMNCSSVPSLDFSACSGMEFGSQVFNGCRSLEWATLPEGMTSLPYATFNNAGILSVNLPSTLERIESDAFGNSGLQSVEIPEGVTRIEGNAFVNASSLKSVVIPSTLEYIGDMAFSGTDLDGVTLPASLKEMGYAAFANSSVSYATFEDGISEIPASAFAGCPYLMFVNLPRTLTTLNENSFASASLAAITSPTADPAATFGAPFTDVNNYTCALSIPKPSYSKYLQAEYWGAFVGIRNCIDITYPEPMGDVTFMDEEDYQDMLEEQEEQEQERPADVRRRALRALARVNALTGTPNCSRLFNGASLYLADNSMIRVFLPEIPDEVKDLKVFYNSRDITDEIDWATRSFVTPALTSTSTLVIESAIFSGIEGVAADAALTTSTPVYSLTGALVGYGPDALKRLPAGIYIVAGKKVTVK